MRKHGTLLALFAVILIDALGWGVAFPVLVPIIVHNSSHVLSASVGAAERNFLYELTLGIYCFFMFLMAPILGSLSDKYGRKRILMLSMFGNFLGFLISGLAIPLHSYMGLLIGRSIAGATAGSLPIAQAAIMDISEESEKASRLGIVVFANVLGFALGPVIGGFFMDKNIFGNQINYQVPFLISCAMGLVGMMLLLLCFKETFKGNRDLKLHLSMGFVNLYKAFSSIKTSRYCCALLCFLMGWGMFFSVIPVFLTMQLNWGGSLIGYFISYIAAILGIVILFILPKLTKRFALTNIVISSLVILFICNLLFPFINNSVAPWFVAILIFSVPLIYVSMLTLLSMQVDSQKQGEMMGVSGSIFAFAWGAGSIIAGSLLKFSLNAPYVLIGIFYIGAAFFFIFHLQHNKKENKK